MTCFRLRKTLELINLKSLLSTNTNWRLPQGSNPSWGQVQNFLPSQDNTIQNHEKSKRNYSIKEDRHAPTLQQILDTMWELQQDKTQDQKKSRGGSNKTKLITQRSRVACHLMEEALRAHEGLHKTNEKLQQVMCRQMTHQGQVDPYLIQAQANSHPFSQAIMNELVPPYYLVSQIIPFSRSGDPVSYLKAFLAQMLILGAQTQFNTKCSWVPSQELSCNCSMGFSMAITSFKNFSQMFVEPFAASKLKFPHYF